MLTYNFRTIKVAIRLNDMDKGINLDFNFDPISHVHIPIKDKLYMKEYTLLIKFFS